MEIPIFVIAIIFALLIVSIYLEYLICEDRQKRERKREADLEVWARRRGWERKEE